MEDLIAWLNRLDAAASGEFSARWTRALVPTDSAPNLTDFLIASHPLGVTLGAPGDRPRSALLLQYLDTQPEINIHISRGLTADLAALASFVSRRRFQLIPEVALSVEGKPGQLTFVSYDDMFDRRIDAPVSNEFQSLFAAAMGRLRTIDAKPLGFIAAAIRFHYASVLLFDREISAAYSLLVAGVEILSRGFGEPPSDFASWDASATWGRVFTDATLNQTQREAIVGQLMRNRELRLGETFATYGSTAPRDGFFDEPIEEWVLEVIHDANGGRWGSGDWHEPRVVGAEVPRDRAELRASLNATYELRSRYVHEAERLDVNSLVKPWSRTPAPGAPLTYAGLRLVLCELIAVELSRHGEDGPLPDIRITGTSQPPARSASVLPVRPQPPVPSRQQRRRAAKEERKRRKQGGSS